MVWACVCVLIQSVSSLLVPGEARHSQHSEDTFQVLTPTHWLSGLHLCFVTGTFLCNGEVGVEPRYDASVSVATSRYCMLRGVPSESPFSLAAKKTFSFL